MSESDTTAVFFNKRISFGLIASSASDGIDLDTSERRMKCHTWHQEQEDDMCRSKIKRKHRVPYLLLYNSKVQQQRFETPHPTWKAKIDVTLVSKSSILNHLWSFAFPLHLKSHINTQGTSNQLQVDAGHATPTS